MPEQYGHSWARLRSRVVFPLPDRPVMTRSVARLQPQIQRIDEPVAGGRTHLDVVELDGVTRAGLGGQHRQVAGLLVGDHQAVQADDRRAIAGELVVGVAEVRQPVEDVAECG